MCVQAGQRRLVIAVFLLANRQANRVANIASYNITIFPYSFALRAEHFSFRNPTQSSMASSEQTPPISGEAPPTPEHTPPPSWIAPPTPQQTPPTPEQIPPTLEQASTTSDQAPPTSDTSRDVDLTYKLVVQRIDGAHPTRCSNPDDHISIRTDTTSHVFTPFIDTDKVPCRSYCSWSGYHGDGSVIYNRREDQLSFGKSNESIFQLGHGVYGTVVKTDIMQFTRGTRHPDGRTEMEEGQYLHMYVTFAAAAGSSARSATVWGKRLVGNETLGTMTLSEEEILRLGKNPWTD